MGKDYVAASTTDSQEEVQAAIQETDTKVVAPVTEEPDPAATENGDEEETDGEEAAVVEEKDKPAAGRVTVNQLEDGEPKSWEKLSKKEIAQKRIDRLTWQREEEKRKVTALEARIASLENSGKKVEDEKPSTKKSELSEDKEPKEEDFESYGAYVKALAKFESAKAGAQTKAEIANANAVSEQQKATEKITQEYQERVKTFASEHDDFDEIVTKNDDIKVSGVMKAAILLSKNGPAIAYHLGSNPSLAGELSAATAKLGADGIPLMIRTLEALLPAPKTGPKEKVADKTEEEEEEAEPIEPVGGSPTKSTRTLDQMDQDEFKRTRNKQEAARLKGRR